MKPIIRNPLVVAASICILALSGWPASAQAQLETQSMLQSMRTGWTTYIFVSTLTPRTSLVELAREASQAGAVLVFRGFGATGRDEGTPVDLQAMQRRIAEIDEECCKGRKVAWVVDPRLFERYHVTAAPSFCVAWGDGGGGAQDFSLVSGDMALASALKFLAQESTLSGIRKRAAAVYRETFGGRS